jgi:hypothetical protein
MFKYLIRHLMPYAVRTVIMAGLLIGVLHEAGIATLLTLGLIFMSIEAHRLNHGIQALRGMVFAPIRQNNPRFRIK